MAVVSLTESTEIPVWATPPGPERAGVAVELRRIGMVGFAGFVVDARVLTAPIVLGLGFLVSRAMSYSWATMTTFALNHLQVFRGAAVRQMRRHRTPFLVSNAGSFAFNYGTYAAVIAFVPLVAANPLLGIGAGPLVGLAGSFVLSRHFVFGQGGNRRPSRNSRTAKAMPQDHSFCAIRQPAAHLGLRACMA